MIDVSQSTEPGIYTLENLLPAELQHALYRLLTTQAQWSWGHGSHKDVPAAQNTALPFWYFELMGLPLMQAVWQAVGERLDTRRLQVKRAYANGHTFGQGGMVHLDDHRPTAYTLLYYPMPEWDNAWAGETLFYDSVSPNARLLHAQVPRPNLGLLFSSHIPHVGRPPSRLFSGLRITVAWKLEVVVAA